MLMQVRVEAQESWLGVFLRCDRDVGMCVCVCALEREWHMTPTIKTLSGFSKTLGEREGRRSCPLCVCECVCALREVGVMDCGKIEGADVEER